MNNRLPPQVLKGTGPWQVGGSGGDADLRLLHTPGRTFGAICVRYAPASGSDATEVATAAIEAAIFTGGLVGYNMRHRQLDGYSGAATVTSISYSDCHE